MTLHSPNLPFLSFVDFKKSLKFFKVGTLVIFLLYNFNRCCVSAKSKKYLIPLRASEALKIPSEYERVKSFPLGHKAPDYCKTAFDLLKGKVKVDDSLFAGCLSWRKEGNFETILESSRKKFVDKWTKDNKSLKGKTDAKNQIKAKYRSVAVLASSKSEEFTKAIKL